jgi:hypothetical protein
MVRVSITGMSDQPVGRVSARVASNRTQVRRSAWFLEKWPYDVPEQLRRAAYRIELSYAKLREVL